MASVKFYKSATSGAAQAKSEEIAGAICFDLRNGEIWLDGVLVAQVNDDTAFVTNIAICEEVGENFGKLKVTYSNGASSYIDVGSSDIDTDDYLGADLTVTGVTVGNLENGTVLSATASIRDVIRRMLVKELDYKVKSNPKVTLTGISASTREIGSNVTATLNRSFTDGVFTPDTGYTASDVNAGCSVTSTSYSGDGVTGDSLNFNMTAGAHNYKVTVQYSASTAELETNLGNPSSATIPAGSVSSSNITLTGCYKYFFGFTSQIPSGDYSSVFTTKSDLENLVSGTSVTWVNNSGATTIGDKKSTDSKSSFVLAIPHAWHISETKNSLGASVMSDNPWVLQNSIQYTVGETTTTYDVYVLHSGISIQYKEIKISK